MSIVDDFMALLVDTDWRKSRRRFLLSAIGQQVRMPRSQASLRHFGLAR